MQSINSLIYLSSGNLPTKWASANQVVKMSQAFSQNLEDFQLVTCGDIWSDFLFGETLDFQEWYGLDSNLKVVSLPVHLRLKRPFSKTFKSYRFVKWSVLYASIKNPSLVYTRCPSTLKLSLEAGLPVVWEWHERFPDNIALNEVASHPNFLGLVTTSQQLANYYTQRGISTEEVLVECNAVDLDRFLPHKTKESARRLLNLSLNSPLIVYAGHLYDYKGIPVILKLADEMKNCSFLLVGGWESDVNRVKRICKDKSLQNVYLTGHISQSQLATYLYAADILILPTSGDWEQADITSPLKLFEYMASQRPVVASALPNVEEVLSHKDSGLLAEPDNSTSFRYWIEYLLANPLIANSISEQAYQRVQSLTWEKRASRILEFADSKLQTANKSQSSRITKSVKYFFSCVI